MKMRGLYVIVDLDFLGAVGAGPLAFADAVLGARPAALQLRAKSLGARATLELLRALVPRCRHQGVPVFSNDRPDLALLAGCGVHLGQADLSPQDARRVRPDLRIGLSTHGLAELDAALQVEPSYVAFGPVFATHSKANPEPVVGLAALAEASRRCERAGVPLVAIGGLTLHNAASVACFASAGAVISGLWPEQGLSGVRERAAALHAAFGGRVPG